MHDGVRIANRAAVHAQGLQPVPEISILEAIREALVEAAYRTHVLRPRRGVPTPPARLTRHAAVHQITYHGKVSNQETPLLVDTHPPEARPIEKPTSDVCGGEPNRKMSVQVYGATSQIGVTAGRASAGLPGGSGGGGVFLRKKKG